MGVPGSVNNLLGAGGAPQYLVERSIRLNSADSAYLSRTPASAGNRKTWTWAGWVKRSGGNEPGIFSSWAGSNPSTTLYFNVDNRLVFYDYNSVYRINLLTTQVFRDFSAWYHIVVAINTTAATSTDRVKIYVNGVQITAFDTATYPALDWETNWNSVKEHNIGKHVNYQEGYLADIHFIDGQALTPSSFTETSAATGQLIPKAYSGSFGTNGFWLKFSDSSAATATTLGKDYSGNNNNWTPNNLAVTGSSTSTTGNISLGSTARNFYFKGLVGHQIGCASGNHVWDSSDGSNWTYRGLGGSTVTLTSTYLLLSGNTNISFTNTNSDLVTYWDLGLSVGVPNGTGTTYTWNVNAYGAQNIDSLTDTPTSYGTDTGAGGEVRGNYCTLNPLNRNSNANLSNGNLNLSLASAGTNYGTFATFGVRTGKWYFEASIDSFISYGITTGFVTSDWGKDYIGSGGTAYFGLDTTGGRRSSAGITASGSTVTYAAGDVVGVAFNADAGTATIYKNGASVYTFSGIPANDYFPALSSGGSSAWINFGQRPFAYTAPSGFKALCDTNQPAPTIALPSTVMDVKLYTGNGSTQTVSGLSFSPDLIWIKSRSAAYDHQLGDTVRGVGNILHSNLTAAESALNTITATTASGFTVDATSYIGTNANGQTFAAWTWDAGTSTVTNTQGSITSQVRANASAGFSIVTYTGNGSSTGATVGHGLGVEPSFFIIKNRSASSDWVGYHKAVGSGYFLILNSTSAAVSSAMWDGAPSSTVLKLNDNSGGTFTETNTNGQNYVAYCFSPVAGYSSISSWIGNGSSDGVFVWTGFRPRFLLWKNTTNVANWYIYDSVRDIDNVVNLNLEPNTSDSENVLTSMNVDFLSNGFKMRGTDGDINGSGSTYVYLAVAESPFQYARAR